MSRDKKQSKIKWANVITNIQSNVLEGLGRYKFLTLTQMLDLHNIGTTQYHYLWRQVASLRDRKKALIGSHTFGSPEPKRGKVEDMYYLSKYGKQVMIDELFILPEQIKIPIGKTMAYRDYHHRKRQIDFQIHLDRWVKIKQLDIPFFDCYFDKTGNNRIDKNLKSKTAIPIKDDVTLIPDGAFQITNKQGKKRLYLFEMYNDRNTSRIMGQIHRHAQAMTNRYTHKKYKLDENKSYTVILLFTYSSIMEAVKQRIKEEGAKFSLIHQYFICACYDELKQESFFEKSWRTIQGEKVVFSKL